MFGDHQIPTPWMIICNIILHIYNQLSYIDTDIFSTIIFKVFQSNKEMHYI